MNYDTISVEMNDGLAVITLNRPEKLNALNALMRSELTDAVIQAGRSARCVVITGADRAFCTGQDLSDRGNATNLELERTLRDEYTPMIKAIVDCPVPTIAAVNGPAAGAGASLALSADVVIAAESAYFMQAFSRIGLMPDAGGTWTMPRLAGRAKAMGAALFADKISATKAEQWGLIWEAVPDAEFDAVWKARAAHLASGPTKAYQAIKAALATSLENDLEEQMNAEAQLQGECGHSRDFQEGVMAFLDKRPAIFEGR